MNNYSDDYRDNLTELCFNGCEANFWSDWVNYILEMVMVPLIGCVGILGNVFSIIIIVKAEGKTTFHQVDISVIQFNNQNTVGCLSLLYTIPNSRLGTCSLYFNKHCKILGSEVGVAQEQLLILNHCRVR